MELRHGDAQAGGTGFAMQACVPSGARIPSVSFAIFAPTYPEGIGLQNQGLQVRVLLGSSEEAHVKTRDRARDLQISSPTVSQLGYRGYTSRATGS